ncbi:MAG: gamma-glutamyl-gamma-aminobutyrate hydrolase family protein [Actinomycetota bacterium]|nr:gamma-glutamyl-gamma-aminobutyrate hydrolase family protein [Actinomycetota bacterium]
MTSRPNPRPVIGIPAVYTTAAWGFWKEGAHLVANTYVSALWDAGAFPIVIPPTGMDDPATFTRILDHVDGLLFVGGADLDPGLYGQGAAPELEETSPTRDSFETPLILAALERDVPLLGICRGVQLMNVATGGSLHQDLVSAGFDDHRQSPGFLDQGCFHDIGIEDNSLLATIAGSPTMTVNSHHHQGIDGIGVGALVTARAATDGCIEAVEWPDRRFALGVQWHPEKPRSAAFFAALVDAAGAVSYD